MDNKEVEKLASDMLQLMSTDMLTSYRRYLSSILKERHETPYLFGATTLNESDRIRFSNAIKIISMIDQLIVKRSLTESE